MSQPDSLGNGQIVRLASRRTVSTICRCLRLGWAIREKKGGFLKVSRVVPRAGPLQYRGRRGCIAPFSFAHPVPPGPFMKAAFTRILALLLLTGFACTPGAAADIDKDRPTSDPISDASLNPWKGDFRTPEQVGLAADEVYFRNPAGHRLRGWLFTVDGADRTILFCMGNSGNISLMMPYAQILQQAGFEVLLFDYQGFGNSEGIASVTSLLTDCQAAMTFLTDSRQRKPADIGLFGVSLGSVLALSLAAEYDVGAVAVEDTFIPAQEVDRLAARYVGKNDMLAQLALSTLKAVFLQDVDPLANVRRMTAPAFFLHGINDWLLPPSGTMTVAAAYRGPKRVWLMDRTGHAPESLEVNETEYARQLQSFFRAAFADTLHEPQVEIVTQQEHIRRIRRQLRFERHELQLCVRCDAMEGETACVQVVLADESGRRRFIRCCVNGEHHLSVETPFKTTHISCVVFHDVTPADDTWTPRLSPFSAALEEFRRIAHRLFGHERTCEYYFARQGQLFYTNPRSLRPLPGYINEDWLQQLPEPAALPERIRVRYAGLLARLDRWPRPGHMPRPGDGLSDLPLAEKMLAYLPEQPEEYYEIGNARFQLEFRDAVVAHSLMELAKRRLRQYKPQAARDLLRLHVTLLPEQTPTNLTPERIASIRVIQDLIGPAEPTAPQ